MEYIYQADTYCEKCGDEICDRIRQSGKAPEDELDLHAYDSDNFPKPYSAYYEESDTPQHCAGCDEFLRNPLTSDGYKYVESSLNELPALTSLYKLRKEGRDVLAEWASWYNFRYWDSEDCADWPEKHSVPGWYSDESY